MDESILTSVKKALHIAEADTAFDPEIVMHINAAFSTLHQLGVGPIEGFAIVDATPTWDTFLLGDDRYNFIPTYVYLKVRLIFDPPQTAHLLNAIEGQCSELEVRINTLREGDVVQPPVVVIP